MSFRIEKSAFWRDRGLVSVDPEEISASERWLLCQYAGGRVFGMPDADLLEVLDTPEIAVLADGSEIEAGDAERFRAHLGVPAIEAAEIEVGRAVWQRACLDRVQIVD